MAKLWEKRALVSFDRLLCPPRESLNDKDQVGLDILRNRCKELDTVTHELVHSYPDYDARFTVQFLMIYVSSYR